ncbi:hypothetical protein M514_14347 [Trichuris suis]|uniref:Uncharacterized protein n=1 Tax=Trichuris suis TaxID=68888 RepID=A0A085LII0_9BILA|nr:hypothetical protein M513_14347 [Trichuris suis]KFD63844.1 hypothetical protein M514_14347 [Trichuris suis]
MGKFPTPTARRKKKEDTMRSRGRNVDAKEREHGLRKTDVPDRKSRRRKHEKNGSMYFEKHFGPPAGYLTNLT